MLFNSLYKAVLCLMRACVSHDDRLNAPVAGFLSALSISLDAKSRRMIFSILVLSRALDTTLRKVETKTCTIPQKDVILWIIANTFLQVCFAFESDTLNKSMHKFFFHWAQQMPNDRVQVKVWHRMWDNAASTGF